MIDTATFETSLAAYKAQFDAGVIDRATLMKLSTGMFLAAVDLTDPQPARKPRSTAAARLAAQPAAPAQEQTVPVAKPVTIPRKAVKVTAPTEPAVTVAFTLPGRVQAALLAFLATTEMPVSPAARAAATDAPPAPRSKFAYAVSEDVAREIAACLLCGSAQERENGRGVERAIDHAHLMLARTAQQ